MLEFFTKKFKYYFNAYDFKKFPLKKGITFKNMKIEKVDYLF